MYNSIFYVISSIEILVEKNYEKCCGESEIVFSKQSQHPLLTLINAGLSLPSVFFILRNQNKTLHEI